MPAAQSASARALKRPLERDPVRAKNTLSVMMHCVAIACLASVLWLLIGYSLAFSGTGAFIGDTAKVQLHWREEPALALVTFDGAKVLGYRLVQLKKGANALALPMEAKLAPNFVLSAERTLGEDGHHLSTANVVQSQINLTSIRRRESKRCRSRERVRVIRKQ